MILYIILAIALTFGLVWLINKFVPAKAKPFIMIALWALIGYLAYINFMSIYEPLQFNKVKEKRYAKVITNLQDLRVSQLAHRQVKGTFQKNFDSLVKFIETEKFPIIERRDSTIIDKELTRRFRVDMTKEIIVIDTLRFVPVKDSLFKGSDRYKTMINVPVGKEGAKFEMDAGIIERNNQKIPVFEVKVDKAIVLEGQDKDLITIEKQVISVDGVNGPTLKVGSMSQVDTAGNWPKVYGDAE